MNPRETANLNAPGDGKETTRTVGARVAVRRSGPVDGRAQNKRTAADDQMPLFIERQEAAPLWGCHKLRVKRFLSHAGPRTAETPREREGEEALDGVCSPVCQGVLLFHPA